MSEANPNTNAAEHNQKPASAGTVLDWGIGSLLDVPADTLRCAEAAMVSWLHRRQEAVDDTRNLVAHLHLGNEPAEALRAQQEWVSRSLRRLAAGPGCLSIHYAATNGTHATVAGPGRLDVVPDEPMDSGKSGIAGRGHTRGIQAITDGQPAGVRMPAGPPPRLARQTLPPPTFLRHTPVKSRRYCSPWA